MEDRGNGRYSIKNDGAIGDWKLDPMDLKYLLPSGKMPKILRHNFVKKREVNMTETELETGEKIYSYDASKQGYFNSDEDDNKLEITSIYNEIRVVDGVFKN